jgi:hypothetical protein
LRLTVDGARHTTTAADVLLIIILHGPSRKHRFQQYLYCCMRVRCSGNVFTEPLPSNGSTLYNIFTGEYVFLLWSRNFLHLYK